MADRNDKGFKLADVTKVDAPGAVQEPLVNKSPFVVVPSVKQRVAALKQRFEKLAAAVSETETRLSGESNAGDTPSPGQGTVSAWLEHFQDCADLIESRLNAVNKLL